MAAYLLGLRHAFDPDHILAIDNSARIAVGHGKPSAMLGFFFSLGHGTIVLVASAIAIVVLVLSGATGTTSAESASFAVLPDGTGIAGTISGSFLVLVGVMNAAICVRIIRSRRRVRHVSARGPAPRPRAQGVLWPVLARLVGTAPRPGRMYVVGLLFGLGLDTAASVTLLIVASYSSTFYGVVGLSVCLPILFLAGMSLGDTLSGDLATRAYRWASSDTRRREVVDLLLTGVSAAAALVVGGLILATAGVIGMVALGIVAAAGSVALLASRGRGKRTEIYRRQQLAESTPTVTYERSGAATP
ncbi:HoxN/HupN/NixA family nickel/cobalt transporter [Salinibacterium sp. NG253]|uniref:HoxN/HupN/NixA family nickel/cobalt transporter n=1 Tax=Salinibacterium sp. NG253 TaxID=2792039 RepID=UPI0018CD2F6C|nr:HoxN/HupN/NixA family nickel/cobalt transporter [Salinibacterium sp. NG253]MBH0115729.1 HoxN/HupN/NixA family nickel/cobalt transporter [Salinibacterium sp. NG253]